MDLAMPRTAMVPAVTATISPVFRSRGATVPVLEDVLQRFASDRGHMWQTYDAIPGLVWHQPEPEPVEMWDVIDSSARYARSGALLLDGFDDTLLPDVEGDVREGNEGESGITLSGTADRIHDIALVKFYPSEDYLGILSRQFASAHVEVFALASDGVQNPHKHAFYRIHMHGSALLYAEVFVDEEGSSSGPGSTTFVFCTSKPIQRIAEMRCREV
jgi:hypothetical protein